MQIELMPEEKAKLEAAFFRVELLRRDLQQLLTQLRQAEQEAQTVMTDILKAKGLEEKAGLARPVFENLALKYLEVPDSNGT